jgi:thioredoxin 1
MAHAVTKENIDSILEGGKPVVLDFWAEWCGPCRMIAPAIEELSKEFEGRATVGKVDIEEQNELATRYGIRSIPTILFFKDGKLVYNQIGAVPGSVLREKLEKLL